MSDFEKFICNRCGIEMTILMKEEDEELLGGIYPYGDLCVNCSFELSVEEGVEEGVDDERF